MTARISAYGPGYHARADDGRPRLVGLFGRRRRFPGRRRDVQQQRCLPGARRRRDVPVLPRDARREGRHARPRQQLRLASPASSAPTRSPPTPMAETMKLCVSCKACRRECPTGVDMARMKIEVSAARAAKRGLTLHDRLVGYLPRYAPIAARLPWLFNLRDVLPGAAVLSERLAGFSARRSLPRWRSDWFRDAPSPPPGGGKSQGESPREGVAAPPRRLPSPLVGEGRGGGSRGDGTAAPHSSPTPTPDPSPQGGGGTRTPRSCRPPTPSTATSSGRGPAQQLRRRSPGGWRLSCSRRRNAQG